MRFARGAGRVERRGAGRIEIASPADQPRIIAQHLAALAQLIDHFVAHDPADPAIGAAGSGEAGGAAPNVEERLVDGIFAAGPVAAQQGACKRDHRGIFRTVELLESGAVTLRDGRDQFAGIHPGSPQLARFALGWLATSQTKQPA